MSTLPRDGLIAVVERDCPTCDSTPPVLGTSAQQAALAVYTQDDPAFSETVPARIDDTALDVSHQLRIEAVPTLMRFAAGRSRTHLWLEEAGWERLTVSLGSSPRPQHPSNTSHRVLIH
jgi:hypothetical protein